MPSVEANVERSSCFLLGSNTHFLSKFTHSNFGFSSHQFQQRLEEDETEFELKTHRRAEQGLFCVYYIAEHGGGGQERTGESVPPSKIKGSADICLYRSQRKSVER